MLKYFTMMDIKPMLHKILSRRNVLGSTLVLSIALWIFSGDVGSFVLSWVGLLCIWMIHFVVSLSICLLKPNVKEFFKTLHQPFFMSAADVLEDPDLKSS